MRFTENNLPSKLLNICFVFLIFFDCAALTACQTKEQKVAAALKKCQDLLDKDDVSAAGECYGKAVMGNPDAATEISKAGEEAVFKKCVELHDRKDYKQAIACFDATTALKPDSANVYFLLADSYYQFHKTLNDGTTDLLDRAEEAVKKGLEIRADDAELHSLYGDILKMKGDLNEAAAEYTRAIKIKPKEILFWIELAIIQEKSNDFWGAISSYNQALLIDSGNTLALYNSGLLYEKLDKIDEAITAYEKLLKIKIEYDDAGERLKKLKKRREDEKQKKPEKSYGEGGGVPSH